MAIQDELLSWLRDAHAMEMQATQILDNQARRIEHYPALRERIQQHLEETRRQAEKLEGCIDRHGGTTSGLKDSAAAFIGNMQAMGGLFVADEVVKGSLASYTFEHLEIASYRSLIAAAEELGDSETARVCTEILREEEAMASWLEQHIPEITREYLRRQASGTQAKR